MPRGDPLPTRNPRGNIAIALNGTIDSGKNWKLLSKYKKKEYASNPVQDELKQIIQWEQAQKARNAA